MEKILDSKGELCHVLFRYSDTNHNKRLDIVEPDNFIQVASLRLQDGDTFKAHQHIWKEGASRVIAQESWVIIKGVVEVFYYDTEGALLAVEVLHERDCSITLYGGHNYKALENNTLVYEFKTGPYTGQENDKTFI